MAACNVGLSTLALPQPGGPGGLFSPLLAPLPHTIRQASSGGVLFLRLPRDGAAGHCPSNPHSGSRREAPGRGHRQGRGLLAKPGHPVFPRTLPNLSQDIRVL